MSNMVDYDAYLDEIAGRTDLTPLDLVRTAAERGWGAIGSTWILRHHFKMDLGEAKGLTATLCAEHGLQAIYEAACKARDPDWPHGRKS